MVCELCSGTKKEMKARNKEPCKMFCWCNKSKMIRSALPTQLLQASSYDGIKHW